MKKVDEKTTVYSIVLYFDYGSAGSDARGVIPLGFFNDYEEAKKMLQIEAKKEKQEVIECCNFEADNVEIQKESDDELIVYSNEPFDEGDYSHLYIFKGDVRVFKN